MTTLINAIEDREEYETILQLIVNSSNSNSNSNSNRNRSTNGYCSTKEFVNEKVYDGWTALFSAALLGRNDIIALLLEHGACVNEADNDGDTPLMFAALNERPETVSLLLQNGAHVNSVNCDGESSLFCSIKSVSTSAGSAASSANSTPSLSSLQVFEMLLKSGADCRWRNKRGLTPLMVAIEALNSPIVEMLLLLEEEEEEEEESRKRNKGTLNESFVSGESPSYNSNDNNTSLCGIDEKDNNGETALFKAARHNSTDIVQLLVSKGASVNEPNNEGVTALMCSAQHHNFESLKLLLTAGASVDKVDCQGNSAFHFLLNDHEGEVVDEEGAFLFQNMMWT